MLVVKTKLFKKISILISLIILINTFITHVGVITPVTTTFILILTITNKVKEEETTKENLLILSLIGIILLYLILPSLTYPTIRTDFHNHASNSKKLANKGTFKHWINKYPRGTHTLLASIIQISPLNYFQTVTITFILLYLLTCYELHQTYKKKIGENGSIFATTLFSFSLYNLWNLQLGYIPVILGMYLTLLYLKNEDDLILSVLYASTLSIVYPHFLIILYIYTFIKGIINKKIKKTIKKLIIIPLITSYELIPFLYGCFTQSKDFLLLIKGGIFVPNLTSILLYSLVIVWILKEFKKEDITNDEVILLTSTMLIQALIIITFLLNQLTKFSKYDTLKQLYMVVKLVYYETIHLSLLAGRKIKNVEVKEILIVCFVFLFTASTVYIKTNNYINPRVYEIGDRVHEVVDYNTTILLDEELINEVYLNPAPFYYDSLLHLSNNYKNIIRVDIEKQLRTNHMSYYNNSLYYNNTWKAIVYEGDSDYVVEYVSEGLKQSVELLNNNGTCISCNTRVR